MILSEDTVGVLGAVQTKCLLAIEGIGFYDGQHQFSVASIGEGLGAIKSDRDHAGEQDSEFDDDTFDVALADDIVVDSTDPEATSTSTSLPTERETELPQPQQSRNKSFLDGAISTASSLIGGSGSGGQGAKTSSSDRKAAVRKAQLEPDTYYVFEVHTSVAYWHIYKSVSDFQDLAAELDHALANQTEGAEMARGRGETDAETNDIAILRHSTFADHDEAMTCDGDTSRGSTGGGDLGTLKLPVLPKADLLVSSESCLAVACIPFCWWCCCCFTSWWYLPVDFRDGRQREGEDR